MNSRGVNTLEIPTGDIDLIASDANITGAELCVDSEGALYIVQGSTKIAIVDSDTMIHWDCPDIFKLSNDKYTAVKDDLSIEWVYNSLVGYKKFFPNTDLDWTDYVNNGILVLPKKNGKEFIQLYLKLIIIHQIYK